MTNKSNIQYAFIPCAGLGTRMGEKGKTLPKVLWKIEGKTLLYWQLLYISKFQPKKIFINVHHQKEKIQEYIQQEKLTQKFPLHILVEDQLLDIGGGIQNLCHHINPTYNGNLVINNADQFIFANNLFNFQVSNNVTLVSMKTFSHLGHREFVLDSKNRLTKLNDISQNKTDDQILTYSGLSFIQLNSIPKQERKIQKIDFFKSVANFNEREIYTHYFNDYEYWDFGTLEKYEEAIKKIQKKSFLSSRLNFFLKGRL